MKMTPRMKAALPWLITVVAILGLWHMASDVSVITGVDLRIAVLPLVALFIYLKFFRKAA
jgi:hypothetical protein